MAGRHRKEKIMSMNTYGLHNHGLLIRDEIAGLILAKSAGPDDNLPEDIAAAIKDGTLEMKLQAHEIAFPTELKDASVAYDVLVYDYDIDASYCSEYTGEAGTLEVEWKESVAKQRWSYEDAFMAWIPLKNGAELISTAYSTPEEIAEELYGQLKDLITKDFDIRPYIVELSGSYFC